MTATFFSSILDKTESFQNESKPPILLWKRYTVLSVYEKEIQFCQWR